jgi:hypothetical protein
MNVVAREISLVPVRLYFYTIKLENGTNEGKQRTINS